MLFTLSDQTVCFLWSIALGAALAAVYDIARAFRMLLRASRVHIIISDIVFFALCGAVTSLFALPFNKGGVRAFTVFGEAAGFLAYRLTLGSIFGKIYAKVAVILRHFSRKICEILKKIYDLLLKAASLLLYNIVEIIVGSFHTAVSGTKLLAGEAVSARAQRSKTFRSGSAVKKAERKGQRNKHRQDQRI